MIELWRKVWRQGIIPQLSTEQLRRLEHGLADDDHRIIQGATTSPPPLMCVMDWPCECACALCYPALAAEGEHTVQEVEDFFARVCHGCDVALGEPGAVGHFIGAYDGWDRKEMRLNLLGEVRFALAGRQTPASEVA